MDTPALLALFGAFVAVISAVTSGIVGLIQARSAAKKTVVDGLAATVAAIQADNVTVHARNADLFSRLTEANDRWQVTDAALVITRRELDLTRQAVTQMAAELAQTQSDLKETQAELCKTRLELEAARQRESELLGRVQTLEDERNRLAQEVKRLSAARQGRK